MKTTATARPTQLICDRDVLAPTGDPGHDAKHLHELQQIATPMLMVYGNPTSTFAGKPFMPTDNTVDVDTVLAYVEHVRSTDPWRPNIVMLNFERGFHAVLQGGATWDDERHALNEVVRTATAIRRENPGVKVGSWGWPLLHYSEYVQADAAGRSALMTAVVRRFRPAFSAFDLAMPGAYETFPDLWTMNPETREYEVLYTGRDIPPDWGGFDTLQQRALAWRCAQIDCAVACAGGKPVYPSYWNCFNTSEVSFSPADGLQLVPERQMLATLKAYLGRKGVRGWNLWVAADHHTKDAFKPVGSSLVRRMLVNALYGGVSPEPARWVDPAFRVECLGRYNDRTLTIAAKANALAAGAAGGTR